jgi:tetratricopeptide (TPR) repeat protein
MRLGWLATLVLLPPTAGGGLGLAGQLSPAQQKIQAAHTAIAKAPDKSQPYNDLATALTLRARESSDLTYCQQAQDAVDESLRLAPNNPEGQRAQVRVLLCKREYVEAREKARALNRRTPDDVPIWGYIAEAATALGDYEEAEKAAQWMLNLRPGNVPGLLCGAALRKVYGDIDGALEFLSQAYQETPPFETEEVARILTHMADLQLIAGKPDLAEKLLGQALTVLPGYYLALEDSARVRAAQHRYAEAVNLLKERNRVSPSPQSIYALAGALEQAGKASEARVDYAEFEGQARRRIEQPYNANRELVFYYTDHTANAAEALRIARIEMSHRHDVNTLDAYAWALHANRADTEARTQIEKALSIGIRDATIFYHAGAITAQQKQSTTAARYLKQSLELNPFSEHAAAAREALSHLEGPSAVAAARQSQP